jgi:hypothetical protein
MRVHVRRNAIVLAITLLALAAAAIPSGRAQAVATTNWFGWGVKIRITNGAPKVTYATYIGTNTPFPTVQQTGSRDISASCTTVGAVTYPNATTVRFNGSSYITCALPAARDELLKLGYTPPSGDGAIATCPAGGGPFWIDANIKGLPATGTYPIYDMSDMGVRVNLQVSGSSARTTLMATSKLLSPQVYSSYSSQYWAINSTSNHVVMGWYGPALVAVANSFTWFDYLSSPTWQGYYNGVTGTALGSWYESPVSTQKIATTGKYELSMLAGTLYIGYSPSSGTYYTGDYGGGGVEPGCKG